MTDKSEKEQIDWSQLSPVEKIKHESRYLRGSIAEGLKDESTGSILESDQNLIKFHGIYQQDDRDQRTERMKRKLEPDYSFMIRVRIPGGQLLSDQWLKLDNISTVYANDTIKLTTRQAVQFHGVIKFKLRKTIQAMNRALLDSIAACGDVNRNVMCTANPADLDNDGEIFRTCKEISELLLPQTRAYHEIWLGEKEDAQLVAGGEPEAIEPFYGNSYLPRKFKIALAVPPHNDTDLFSNDIGLIAILKEGKLTGYNICAGGGMGMTFGMPETHPRLGDVLGYSFKEDVKDFVFHIAGIQRDLGNRSNRKLARLKYTIERIGVENFSKELEKRAGKKLEKVRHFQFDRNADYYGWRQDSRGNNHLTLFVEGGRVKDVDGLPLKTALREIAENELCRFILTGNQNLILADVSDSQKNDIEAILKKHGLQSDSSHYSGLRRCSIACVALNTCPLAMGEGERYLPKLIDRLEPILAENGLTNDEITIRMTGCPNGCGRPYLGEIGFVGKSIGYYNMYLGASFKGDRLNRLYRENIDEAVIIEELRSILSHYAQDRKSGEKFGDFCLRQEYIRITTHEQGFGA